jgi:hypothetical protein
MSDDDEDKTDDTLEVLSNQNNELHNWLYGRYKIGRYEVNNLCLDTRPCQHRVYNTYTNECFLLNKYQIYMLCIWYWVDIPHFYPDWRKRWTD